MPPLVRDRPAIEDAAGGPVYLHILVVVGSHHDRTRRGCDAPPFFPSHRRGGFVPGLPRLLDAEHQETASLAWVRVPLVAVRPLRVGHERPRVTGIGGRRGRPEHPPGVSGLFELPALCDLVSLPGQAEAPIAHPLGDPSYLDVWIRLHPR